MTTPGVEPGLSRPQRDVLTTRRCGRLIGSWRMPVLILCGVCALWVDQGLLAISPRLRIHISVCRLATFTRNTVENLFEPQRVHLEWRALLSATLIVWWPWPIECIQCCTSHISKPTQAWTADPGGCGRKCVIDRILYRAFGAFISSVLFRISE